MTAFSIVKHSFLDTAIDVNEDEDEHVDELAAP